MPDITLYELEPTRSARCRWTLREAGLSYTSINNGRELIGSDELIKIHPLGKLPAAVIDGKPLFESAAIAVAIADLVPEKNLIAKPGSWERNLHNQWVLYSQTEMEAWLWSSAINTFLLPEELRITAHLGQNAELFRRSAAVLDSELGESDYLIAGGFSVTDIIVGYTVNFGKNFGLLDGFSNLERYWQRLTEREHCPFGKTA